MSKKRLFSVLVSGLFITTAAWSQSTEVTTSVKTEGDGQTATATSERQVPDEETPSVVDVYERPWQLTLSPGVLSYEAVDATDQSRLATSIIAERNFSPAGPAPSPIQYGGEFGLIYSHLGAPDAGFFGTGGDQPGGDGNLFVIPLHLWGGYYWDAPGILASIHTGADLYMSTNDESIATGRDSQVNFFPAIGFQLGVDTRQNFAITFQSNWTLVPNEAVYSALIGATIPLT